MKSVSPARRVLMAGLGSIVLGCYDAPSEPTSSVHTQKPHSAVQQGLFSAVYITGDDRLRELAMQVRGFGGIYRSVDGVIHVKLTDLGTRPVALPAVLAFMRRYHMVRGADTPRMLAEQAEFSFDQLKDAYDGIRGGLPRDGVTQTDIDERANQIVLGVRDERIAQSLRSWISARGLPPTMVSVRVIAPTVTSVGVRDRVEPAIGGIRIETAMGDCTMGFQVSLSDAMGNWLGPKFVTNSHCFADIPAAKGSGSTFAAVGQPDLNRLIGYEEYDAPFVPYYYCRTGRSCRYSDATLVAYNPGVSNRVGHIARLSPEGDGNAQINDVWLVSTPSLSVAGDFAKKVGQRSGQTTGSIENVCVDVTQYYSHLSVTYDSEIDMLCQDQATYGQGRGDSGSPVFTGVFTGEARPLGLHWGGAPRGTYADTANGFISTFSPIGAVRYDLSRGYSWQENCARLASMAPQPGCPANGSP